MPKKPQKDLSFEQSMERLEEIVQELEGTLNLDKSLGLFEEGMKLAKNCQDKLDQAKGRVEKVMKDFSGREKIVPLTDDDISPENSD